MTTNLNTKVLENAIHAIDPNVRDGYAYGDGTVAVYVRDFGHAMRLAGALSYEADATGNVDDFVDVDAALNKARFRRASGGDLWVVEFPDVELT